MSSMWDYLTDPPSGNPIVKWGIGVVVASGLVLCGLRSCMTQHAYWIFVPKYGRSDGEEFFGSILHRISFYGYDAVALGSTYVFAGLFLHFQCFWRNHPVLSVYYEIGKYLSLLGFAISVLCLLIFLLSGLR